MYMPSWRWSPAIVILSYSYYNVIISSKSCLVLLFCFDIVFLCLFTIQDCEKMSEKADEVGMGKIFHAAILALNRQDEDSKVPTSPFQCISVGANMADLQRSLFQKCWSPKKWKKTWFFSAEKCAGAIFARSAVDSPSLSSSGCRPGGDFFDDMGSMAAWHDRPRCPGETFGRRKCWGLGTGREGQTSS